MLPNCDNSAAYPASKMISPQRLSASSETAVSEAATRLAAAPVDLNVQIADFLPQRVAVEAEQIGGADLIAARRRQRCGEQRDLDFLEDAVVEARRRDAVRKAREVRGQIGLDRAAEIIHTKRRVTARCDG